MRRVIVPAFLAIALVACCTADSQAGPFSKLCGGGGCDTGCAVEPSCGCEATGCLGGCGVAAPSCGCEVAGCSGGCGDVYAAPSCGCEVAPSCGGGCGGGAKGGLLAKLFGKRGGCGGGCAAEPTCGVEVVGCGGCGDMGCAGGCGDVYAAPSCGCEAPAPACGGAKKCGLLAKIFGKRGGGGCGGCVAEPTCGVEAIGYGGCGDMGCAGGCGEVYAAPAPCGCSAGPSCGAEAPCGCAN